MSPRDSLPTRDLRSNRGTWLVPAADAPAVAACLLAALPREIYDPDFAGQRLATTYFDTPRFRLRKARHRRKRYLTLRVRSYQAAGRPVNFALSAKTEAEKFRLPITADEADALLAGPAEFAPFLPGHLLARLLELTADQPILPVVTVYARRYGVEDEVDRFTLDLGVRTDAGKAFPAGVLEFKSGDPEARPPADLAGLKLRPVQLSKFLWATLWR